MISRNKYWFPDEDGTYALFYTWFYEPLKENLAISRLAGMQLYRT